MTGRYQDRFGFTLNPTIDPKEERAGLPLEERNIVEVLRPLGHTSMIIGKWHMGTHPRFHPLIRGFDKSYGLLSGGHDYFPEDLTLNDLKEVREQWGWHRTKILRNRTPVETDEYLTDELSNEAVLFVERHHADEGPFFLYLAYNAPRTPMQATRRYLDRFPNPSGTRKTCAAMSSAVDDGVGRLIAKLREHDLEESTLSFYSAVRRGLTGRHACFGKVSCVSRLVLSSTEAR